VNLARRRLDRGVSVLLAHYMRQGSDVTRARRRSYATPVLGQTVASIPDFFMLMVALYDGSSGQAGLRRTRIAQRRSTRTFSHNQDPQLRQGRTAIAPADGGGTPAMPRWRVCCGAAKPGCEQPRQSCRLSTGIVVGVFSGRRRGRFLPILRVRPATRGRTRGWPPNAWVVTSGVLRAERGGVDAHLRLTFATDPVKSLRKTCPPFMTNFTRSSSVTSFAGFPETATKSAYLPLSMDPTQSR
jgi:hypothetical protein